ncbi:MAG: DEAD/DEAH box helicase [Longimonas sp.]|uniref:DEAD/DEAH box helicase n=1 Tax=Longimonas sp. TaxID=2039626 RepID=UPI00397495BB
MSTPFTALGLSSTLADTVSDRGYTTPTPIQEALIPSMLAGRDVVGQAQTGMGKTAAFALPMIHTLGEGTGTLRGIVVTPTRELAKQVAEAVYAYGNRLDIRVLPIYGGQPYHRQTRRLDKGVDVVVGTPGRMLDLIRKGALDLSAVQVAVLDEADEMLSMGFIEDIKAILAATPSERQTAFFSATMSNDFQRLAKQQLDNPASCRLEPKERTVSSIEQRYYPVAKRDRTPALMRLLETEDITSAIVFARTRNDTFRLADTLQSNGYNAGALNGEMDQPERQRMLDRFRNSNITILVGTNVAARGLDIDHVSHVFNYNLPRDPQVYVHRVGRTGRAGRSGTALTLVTPNRRKRLKQTERHIKRTIERTDVPSDAQVQAHRDATLRAEVATWMAAHDPRRERDIVDALVDEGHDPAAIAAAALHEARTRRKATQRQDNAPKQAARPADSHEDGMVRLRLNTGKRNNTRPGQIVGTLASATKMPGSAIGRIDIHPSHTMVDVPSEYVQQVRAKSGSYKIGRQRVRVE